MRKALVKGIRNHVLAGDIVVLLGGKSPPLLLQMPVHHGEGDNVLETLEFSGDQSSVRPWTGVADVEMIPPLFGRKLGTGLAGDPVAERADLTLELASCIAGFDPVGDFALVGSLQLLNTSVRIDVQFKYPMARGNQ